MEELVIHRMCHSASERIKAQQDTRALIAFLREKDPTDEHVAELKAMLADQSLCIDLSASCHINFNAVLLTCTRHLAFRNALLEAGADPGWDAGGRCTPPLHHAVEHGDIAGAQLLLEHGADAMQISHAELLAYDHLGKDDSGKHIRAMVSLLTRHGGNPNICLWRNGWNHDFYADRILESLADMGAHLMITNRHGDLIETPITNGRGILKEVLVRRRKQALAIYEPLASAMADLRAHNAHAPAAADHLAALSHEELMALSNLNRLGELFDPALWEGREQAALALMVTLHPYQQTALAQEMALLYERSQPPPVIVQAQYEGRTDDGRQQTR